jgi:hypothetical protein
LLGHQEIPAERGHVKNELVSSTIVKVNFSKFISGLLFKIALFFSIQKQIDESSECDLLVHSGVPAQTDRVQIVLAEELRLLHIPDDAQVRQPDHGPDEQDETFYSLIII